MFLGHYGLALAAKRVAPRTSLGTLVLAAQLLDIVWPALLLAGVERVRVVPGLMPASALDFVHYPISHSLAMALVWSVAAGAAYYALQRHRRGALVVGALVLSHWLLDAAFHRPDLPLWPGSDMRVGGGLWNSLPITVTLELAALLLGVVVYRRVTRPTDRIGSWGLWTGVAVLVLFFVGSLAGPPPADERMLALGGITLWLLVPWAWWVDRHRTRRGDLLSDR